MIRNSLEIKSAGAAPAAGKNGVGSSGELYDNGESFANVPLAQLLCHGNWKARKQGWMSVHDHAQESKSTALGHAPKLMKEGNAAVQEEILAASVQLLEVCDKDEQTELAKGVLPLVFEKGLTGRPRAVEVSTSLVDALVAHGHASLVFDIMLPVFAHRTPKNRLAAASVCAQLIRDYGVTPFPLKLVVQKMQPLFNDVNSQVRKEAITLCCQCYRYIGAGIKCVLTDLRDVQMQELERQFDNVTVGSVPVKYVRGSEPCGDAASGGHGNSSIGVSSSTSLAGSLLHYQAALAGGGAGNNGGSNSMCASNDVFEQLPQKAVLSKLPPSFYEKALDKSVGWQERCSFVSDTLLPLLSAPRFRAKDNYHELAVLMREYLIDCQAPVMLLGFKMIQECARGLRADFAPFARQYLVILFDKMKDKKKSVLEHITMTLETLLRYRCITLDQCSEDMDLVSRSKNPSQRAALLQFCIRVMDKLDVTQYSKLAHDVALLRRLVNDDKASNRDLAYVLLQKLIASVGDEVYEPVLRSMDEKQLVKMRAVRVLPGPGPHMSSSSSSNSGAGAGAGMGVGTATQSPTQQSITRSTSASSFSHTGSHMATNPINTPSCSPAKKLARVDGSAVAHDTRTGGSSSSNVVMSGRIADKRRVSATQSSAAAAASSAAATTGWVAGGDGVGVGIGIDTALPSRQESLITLLGLLNGDTAVYDGVRSSEWAQRLDAVTRIKAMTDGWTVKQCNQYMGHVVVYLETYPGWRESTAQVFTRMLSTLLDLLERATVIPVGVACALIAGCAPRLTEAKHRPLLRELCARLARHVGVGLVMRQVMAVAMQIRTPRLLLECNTALVSWIDDYAARVAAAVSCEDENGSKVDSSRHLCRNEEEADVHNSGDDGVTIAAEEAENDEDEAKGVRMNRVRMGGVRGGEGAGMTPSTTESLILAEGFDVKGVVDYLVTTGKEQLMPALRPSAVALLLKLRNTNTTHTNANKLLRRSSMTATSSAAEAIVDGAMSNFAPAFQNAYWHEVHKSGSAALSRSGSTALKPEEDTDCATFLHPSKLHRLGGGSSGSGYGRSSNALHDVRPSSGSSECSTAGLTGAKMASSSMLRRHSESASAQQQQLQLPASGTASTSVRSSQTMSIRRQSSVTTSHRVTGSKAVPLAYATAAHVAAVLQNNNNNNNNNQANHNINTSITSSHVSHDTSSAYGCRALSNEEISIAVGNDSGSGRVGRTAHTAAATTSSAGGFRLPLSSVAGDRASTSMHNSFSHPHLMQHTNISSNNANNHNNLCSMSSSSSMMMFMDEHLTASPPPLGRETAASSQSPRVSVATSSEAPPSLKIILAELNRASDWRERLEAVHRIEDHIAHHHGTLSTRAVAPVLQALGKRLSESNKNVLVDVLRVVMLSVEAAGHEASRASFRAILPGVMDLLGDQKAALRDEARRVLALGVRVVGIEGLLPCLPKPLQSESVLTRQSTLEAMAMGFECMTPHAAVPRAVLQLLIAPVVRGLMDRVQEIRQAAERVLGYVMRILGPDAVHHYVHQLKPADRFVVTPAVERQAVLGGLSVSMVTRQRSTNNDNNNNEEEEEEHEHDDEVAVLVDQTNEEEACSRAGGGAEQRCAIAAAVCNAPPSEEGGRNRDGAPMRAAERAVMRETDEMHMSSVILAGEDRNNEEEEENDTSRRTPSRAHHASLSCEAGVERVATNRTPHESAVSGRMSDNRAGLDSSISRSNHPPSSSSSISRTMSCAVDVQRSAVKETDNTGRVGDAVTPSHVASSVVSASASASLRRRSSTPLRAGVQRARAARRASSSSMSALPPAAVKPEGHMLPIAEHSMLLDVQSTPPVTHSTRTAATRKRSITMPASALSATAHKLSRTSSPSTRAEGAAATQTATTQPHSRHVDGVDAMAAREKDVARKAEKGAYSAAASSSLLPQTTAPNTPSTHLQEACPLESLSNNNSNNNNNHHDNNSDRDECSTTGPYTIGEIIAKMGSASAAVARCMCDDVRTHLAAGEDCGTPELMDVMVRRLYESAQSSSPSSRVFNEALAMSLLSGLGVVFASERALQRCHSSLLFRLLGMIFSCLLSEQFALHETVLKALNSTTLKLLQGCVADDVFSALLSRMTNYSATYLKSGCRADLKYIQVTVKCIMRVDLARVSADNMILCCHEYLLQNPPSAFRQLDDLPIRTIKTVLQEMTRRLPDTALATADRLVGSHNLVTHFIRACLDMHERTVMRARSEHEQHAGAESQQQTQRSSQSPLPVVLNSQENSSSSSSGGGGGVDARVHVDPVSSGSGGGSASLASAMAASGTSDAGLKKWPLSAMTLPPSLPHVSVMGREVNNHHSHSGNEEEAQCRSSVSGDEQRQPTLSTIFGRIRNHVTSSQGIHDLYMYLCHAPANYEDEFNHQLSRCSEAFRMYIKRKLEAKATQEGGAAASADGSSGVVGCFQMPPKLQALK